MNLDHPKSLWLLRTSDSGCGSLRMIFSELTLVAEYEYRDAGKDWIGALKFISVLAYRYRDEMHSLGFAANSYDALVEVQNSTWLASLRDVEPKGISGTQGKRHFAVLFSSNGYLEVIAEFCEECDSREGRLS